MWNSLSSNDCKSWDASRPHNGDLVMLLNIVSWLAIIGFMSWPVKIKLDSAAIKVFYSEEPQSHKEVTHTTSRSPF